MNYVKVGTSGFNADQLAFWEDSNTNEKGEPVILLFFAVTQSWSGNPSTFPARRMYEGDDAIAVRLWLQKHSEDVTVKAKTHD